MTPDASNQTLAEIVSQAKTGEPAAVEALVRRSRATATRHAFAILGDRSLAEDAAQEALAQAVASLGDLRAPEAFLSWLRRIVHRHCDRITRAQRLRVVRLVDLVDPADGDPQPEELIVRAERALAVRSAVRRLPEGQRDAATAFYLEGLSQAEAADVLGIPVSTLNNRLHAARRALERNLISMSDDNRPARSLGRPQLVAPSPEADTGRILSALEAANPAGTDWRHGRLSKSRFDWSTSRLAIGNSEIRALVGVYDVSMRIGHAAVRTAGFNLDYAASNAPADVVAHVTRETADAAAAAGYGLAVAVGHTEALRSAGFAPAWPHSMTFVPRHALPDPPPNKAEAFEPVPREDLTALNDTDNAGLTGTGVGPTYLSNKEPGGFQGRQWRDEVGEVAGYVSYAIVDSWRNPALLGPSHRGYGRLLWHDQSAGDTDTRLAVLADLAREHNCDEVVFDRLHARSPLARRLRLGPHRVEQGTRRYSIRVLSLDTVVRAIVDELDRRLAAALGSSEASLRMTIDAQTVTLRPSQGHLTIGAEDEDVAGTILGDQRLANLLVGTQPPAEVLLDSEARTTGGADRLAAILFPDQAPQMDNQTL